MGMSRLGSQFSQSMKIHIEEGFLEPVVIQPLELTPNAQRLFVGIGRHWIGHQLEFRAHSVPAGAVRLQIEVDLARGMKLVGVPSQVFNLQRLPGVIVGCGQYERTGVSGHLVSVTTEESVKRQARRLGGDVIEADVERPIGIDGNVVPPPVVHPEVLPVLLSRQWILAEEKGLQGGGRDLPGHFGAAPRKAEGVTLDALAGFHGNHEEIEGRFSSYPHLRVRHAFARIPANANLD